MAQLGDRVREKITGFTGIVTSRTTWLNGCVRIGVQSEELKDGKPQDSTHFDLEQVEVVVSGVHKPVVLEAVAAPPPTASRSGGPARETAGFHR